ncbi:hypothetical protein Nepgr_033008 [Nepenthes gracilis]|uniref:Dof-type domain-containing protein n=1 Tax=Nepenthes gracilis TaxID=150966 RepID=A0AAD3TKF3_NEPGR|nr:hypothetical protein Nepgr_033008 [Nepenthes gracilis]
MSEVKDPAIKLFGKTIPLSSNEEVDVVDGEHSNDRNILCSSNSSQSNNRDDKNASATALMDTEEEERSSRTNSEEFKDPATQSAISDTPRTPFADKEANNAKKEEQSETSTSEEKPLKKPDKILPCPRCNSMDTKFCYFNNYNVNQPRYFCRSCQRYWTAGGTMRNVPVGAGRRKNKSSSASHCPIVIPEVFQAPQSDAVNSIIDPGFRANATVLTFGSDVCIRQSMAPALNLVDKSPNCIPNGFIEPENANSSSRLMEKESNAGIQGSTRENLADFTPQPSCLPVPPWPYPCNPAQWSSASRIFPMSFYATPPYWGCGLVASCNLPWLMPPSFPPVQSSTSSGFVSPILGKHSRDGNTLKSFASKDVDAVVRKGSESRVLVPKTLRIDDPTEAAKSSIWATLGIKNEKGDSINSGVFLEPSNRREMRRIPLLKNLLFGKRTLLHYPGP